MMATDLRTSSTHDDSSRRAAAVGRKQRLLVRSFMLIVTSFCLLLVFSHGIFASRFTADSEKIQSIAQGLTTYDDKAFTAVGDLYAVLGLANHASLAGFLGFGLFVLVLWTVSGTNHLEQADWLTIAMIGISLIFAAIYLGQYNKDFIELGVTLIAGAGTRGKSSMRDLLLLASILVFASYVRSYWVLIAAVYVVFRWALKRGHRPSHILLDTLALYVGLAVAFLVLRHQDLDYGRTSVNGARDSMQLVVNTLITGPIADTGFMSGLLNSIVTGAFLLVPLPLVSHLQVAYVLVGAFIALMWVSMLRLLVRYSRQSKVRDAVIERSLALILAIVLVQSLFEPDYGSYVRHLTPILPLFVMLSIRARALLPNSRDEFLTARGMTW